MKNIRQAIFAITALMVLQSFTVMAFGETEKQKYRVIRSEKDFEIRFYPSAILATVYSDAKSYSDLAYPGFRKLAGYIFGGNESETKISLMNKVLSGMAISGTWAITLPSSR